MQLVYHVMSGRREARTSTDLDTVGNTGGARMYDVCTGGGPPATRMYGDTIPNALIYMKLTGIIQLLLRWRPIADLHDNSLCHTPPFGKGYYLRLLGI